MELYEKFKEIIRDKIVRKPDFVQKTENFSGKDPKELNSWDWYHLKGVIRGKDSNAFNELGIVDNPENRINIISSFLHTDLAESWPELVNSENELNWFAGGDIEQAELVFSHIFNDLGFLLQGNKFDLKANFFDKDNSYRHSERTAWIAEVTLEEIWERSENGDPKAKEVVEQIPKGAIYPAGFLHDVGRLVDQGSKHDVYGEEILKRAGIRKEVVDSIHSPVSTNSGNEDSNAQRIVRLADVFAKVAETDSGEFLLRGSIEEVSKYSLKRQTDYLEKEHEETGSFWYGKNMDDVNEYVKNEKLVLESTEKWLQSMGIDLNHFIIKMNNGIRGEEGLYLRNRP